MGLIRCEIATGLVGVRGVLALHALVLIPKTFCGSFFYFFILMFCFLGMVREKRGGRVGQREDAVWLLMEALDNA